MISLKRKNIQESESFMRQDLKMEGLTVYLHWRAGTKGKKGWKNHAKKIMDSIDGFLVDNSMLILRANHE